MIDLRFWHFSKDRPEVREAFKHFRIFEHIAMLPRIKDLSIKRALTADEVCSFLCVSQTPREWRIGDDERTHRQPPALTMSAPIQKTLCRLFLEVKESIQVLSIVETLIHLRSLTIIFHDNVFLSRSELLALRGLDGLRTLTIRVWKKAQIISIADHDLDVLTRSFPRLEKITFQAKSQLTAGALTVLGKNCPSLRYLNLAYTTLDLQAWQHINKVIFPCIGMLDLSDVMDPVHIPGKYLLIAS